MIPMILFLFLVPATVVAGTYAMTAFVRRVQIDALHRYRHRRRHVRWVIARRRRVERLNARLMFGLPLDAPLDAPTDHRRMIP